MEKKSVQNLLIALLLILPVVALAQSRNSMDLYRKHHDQLPESHRAHQRFLMQDAARAMRVLEKYGWLDESSKDAKAPTTDDTGENGAETEAAGTIALNKAASRLKPKDLAAQLHTAASEIQTVATALQRAPLPPDGFWLKHAQGLKKSSARLARLAVRPTPPASPPSLRGFKAPAMSATACTGVRWIQRTFSQVAMWTTKSLSRHLPCRMKEAGPDPAPHARTQRPLPRPPQHTDRVPDGAGTEGPHGPWPKV